MKDLLKNLEDTFMAEFDGWVISPTVEQRLRERLRVALKTASLAGGRVALVEAAKNAREMDELNDAMTDTAE